MADVFISYKSERRPAAHYLSQILELNGFSAWYDYGLFPGEDFEKRLMAEIAAARVVLVLWCEMSIESRWVLKEAAEAKAAGKLLPSWIQRVTPPDEFARDDIVDLSGWDGAPRSPDLDRPLQEIGRRLGRTPAPDFTGLVALHQSWTSFGAPSLARFALEASSKPPEEVGARQEPVSARPTSLSARAFAAIAEQLDAEDYEDFVAHWRGSDEAAIAAVRAEALRRWAGIDKDDPEAIQEFQCPAGFSALSRAVSEALGVAQEAKLLAWETQREARRRERELDRAFPHLHVFRDALRSGGEGPEMVVIPEGEFMMSSHADEPKRTNAEGPQHLVRIEERFGLGKYAVTRGEFADFVTDSGHDMSGGIYWYDRKGWKQDASKSWRDPGFAQNDRHPVVGVSWNDAQAYCLWLSKQTGATYRLSSEAEWEYACRGRRGAEPSSTPFGFEGRVITPEQANYRGKYVYAVGGAKGTYRNETVPVDLKDFESNPFGLHQMHGNVWEWCEDAWNDSYNGAPDDGSPYKIGDTSQAVLRGGPRDNNPYELRSAYRLWFHCDIRIGFIGFRVARTIVSP